MVRMSSGMMVLLPVEMVDGGVGVERESVGGRGRRRERIRAICERPRSTQGRAGPIQPATEWHVGARTLPTMEVAVQ